MIDVEEEFYIKQILSMLTPKNQGVLMMRLNGYDLRSIAKKYNISKEAIRKNLLSIGKSLNL